MKKSLPIRLNKEPLVDVIFEVRFTSLSEISEILPGIFFSQLAGSKSLTLLPASQLPKVLRDQDPNLIFAPTTQIVWNNFRVNIGNRCVAINCTLPYPGWLRFKQSIIKVVKILDESRLVSAFERCSIKYVDLLESKEIKQQMSYLNFTCQLAGENLDNYPFTLRVEKEKDDTLNIIQIMAPAKVEIKQSLIKEGIIVDVDTIINLKEKLIKSFIGNIDDYLEKLHQVNKKIFFDCLTENAVVMLEPTYE